MTYIRPFLLLVTFTFISIPSLAQDAVDSHQQAAEELLRTMDAPALLDQSVDAVIDGQIQAVPDLAMFEDIMKSFMRKYMSWDNMRPIYIDIYMEAFTETELREITAFYKTKTGKKSARLTPMLLQQGMEAGQQLVQEHLPELEQQIQARVIELQESDLD